MSIRPAGDVTLAHGGNTVRLRPSLRAATILERLHGGFPQLFGKLAELDTATVVAVVSAAATAPQDAERFILSRGDAPLASWGPDLPHLLELCHGLIPAPADDRAEPAPAGEPEEPITWPEAFARLYGFATGWLGWTPAEAWAATPTEIAHAFAAHADMLRAIHGAADDAPDAQGRPKDGRAAQRAQNVAEGLDPDFDRAAFAALRAKITGGA